MPSPALAINGDPEVIEDGLHKLFSVFSKARKESKKWMPKGVDSDCSMSPAIEDDDLTPSFFKHPNMKLRAIIEKRYQNAIAQV